MYLIVLGTTAPTPVVNIVSILNQIQCVGFLGCIELQVNDAHANMAVFPFCEVKGRDDDE